MMLLHSASSVGNSMEWLELELQLRARDGSLSDILGN